MNLFKKKKEKIGWDNVTLGQYLKLYNIDKDSDTAFIDMVEILFGEDISKLAIDKYKEEVTKKSDELKFISEDVEPHLPKKKYLINSRIYVLNLRKVTTAQFMDYVTLSKSIVLPQDTAKLLSVFLVPEGKTYGEYDMEEVVADINELPITDALGISVFFKASLLTFIQHFRYYSTRRIMRLKISKEEKEKLIAEINKTTDSVSSLM